MISIIIINNLQRLIYRNLACVKYLIISNVPGAKLQYIGILTRTIHMCILHMCIQSIYKVYICIICVYKVYIYITYSNQLLLIKSIYLQISNLQIDQA